MKNWKIEKAKKWKSEKEKQTILSKVADTATWWPPLKEEGENSPMSHRIVEEFSKFSPREFHGMMNVLKDRGRKICLLKYIDFAILRFAFSKRLGKERIVKED